VAHVIFQDVLAQAKINCKDRKCLKISNINSLETQQIYPPAAAYCEPTLAKEVISYKLPQIQTLAKKTDLEKFAKFGQM